MVTEELFNNFKDDKLNFSSFMDTNKKREEDDLVFKKRKGLDIDLNIGEGSSGNNSNKEETKEEPKKDEKDDGSNGGEGGGFGFDINAPDINIDIPKIPEAKITAPNIDIDVPKIADIDVEPIASTFIDTAEQAYKQTKEVTDSLLNSVGQTIEDKLIDPLATTSEQLTKMVGDSAKPISEILEKASEPVAKVINESLASVGEMFENADEYVSDNTSIVKGTGQGYGEVAIGDTGYAVDASKVLDDAVSVITKDTALEGVPGKDIYTLATNPTEFVATKSAEAATQMLTDNIGLDAGFAGDIVGAISNPDEFIKDKGEEVATSFVTETLGIDKGLAGAGIEILTSGNVGKAAEMVARQAATEATLNAVSVIPIAGPVIAVLARIFQYSCYLGTAAYVDGYISKKDFLQFYRYRIKCQKHEFLGDESRIGYLILFSKIFDYQVTHQSFNKYVTRYITLPWYKHISYLLGKRKFSLHGWTITMAIRLASLFTYMLSKSNIKDKMRKHLSTLNILKVYTKTIKIVEGAK